MPRRPDRYPRLTRPQLSPPLAVGAALAGLLTACSREIGDRDLLFPRPHPVQTERPDRRNITVPLPDGTRLRGWHLHHDARPLTVLYWYGNGETVLASSDRLEWMAAQLGVNVVAVDYRGYGFSEGTASVAAAVNDAVAVYDYARDELGVGEPVLFGRSLGTAPALRVAGSRPVRGLILEAPFPSLDAVLKAWQRNLPPPFRWLVRLEPAPQLRAEGATPLEVIRAFHEPLLILHGSEDRTIPPALGRAMFEAAPGPNKRWCDVPETNHNNLDLARPEVADALRRFAAECATPGEKSPPQQ
jgi:fermentation-respiration switch protein FrsA (DUF1100 family)